MIERKFWKFFKINFDLKLKFKNGEKYQSTYICNINQTISKKIQ